MVWQPLNLSSTCSPQSHLTACSPLGYIFLNLLVELYGHPIEKKNSNFGEKLGLNVDNSNKKHELDYERINEGFLEEAYDIKNVKERRLFTPENEDYDERGANVNDEDEEFDFIIVGAGSAGCVLANRLTEVQGWKVLLLEAGDEQPAVTLIPSLYTALQGSNVDWQFKTEPNGRTCLAEPDQRCSWHRGKMMGGSSSINTMIYIRGHSYDYDTWARMGNHGWNYSQVLPYFIKAERNMDIKYREHQDSIEKPLIDTLDKEYHGTKGPLSVSFYPHYDDIALMPVKAFMEKGLPLIDLNSHSNYGVSQAQSTTINGIRGSANQGYIQPIRYKRKNLGIKTNSEVFQILVDKNKRAYGVKYERNGKVYKATAKKEIIVSSGTINSPKLLMLSGIGPKQHLRELQIPVIEDLAVGMNLHDHVNFQGLIIALPNKTNTAICGGKLLKKMYEYKEMIDKRGPLADVGSIVSIAFSKTDFRLPAPDIQYYPGDSLMNWREYWQNPIEYNAVSNIFPTVFYDSFSPKLTLLTPKSRGYIKLNASNPYGPPVIQPNFYADLRDLKTVIKAARLLYALENTYAFQASGAHYIKDPIKYCEEFVWGTDEYTQCLAQHYYGGVFHAVGTCKMGPESDPEAVVDPRLRVYGIKGLRVIDASIIPVVPRGNTNAPTIMVAEKAADMVKEDWLVRKH